MRQDRKIPVSRGDANPRILLFGGVVFSGLCGVCYHEDADDREGDQKKTGCAADDVDDVKSGVLNDAVVHVTTVVELDTIGGSGHDRAFQYQLACDSRHEDDSAQYEERKEQVANRRDGPTDSGGDLVDHWDNFLSCRIVSSPHLWDEGHVLPKF